MRIIGLLIAFGMSGLLGAQPRDPRDSDIDYAFGMDVAQNLKAAGIRLQNSRDFIQGFMDTMEGKPPRIPETAVRGLIEESRIRAQERIQQENLAQAQAYLEKNKKKPGVQETLSGLQYEILDLAMGPKPRASDQVKVHYRGSFLDGKEFDSSYKRESPVTFRLDQVIPGWMEALQLMPEGSRFRLTIPPHLGYGHQGAGSVVPPNTLMIFEVELLEIMPDTPPKKSKNKSRP